MSISAANLKIRFSTKAGSAGDTEVGTGAGSLGKYVSTTEITSGLLHDLFDIIAGDENAASEAEYRCIFMVNESGTDTFLNPKIYVLSQVSGGASIAIGIDPTAPSDAGSATAQAVEIVDEDTAPAGVTFSTPVTAETALAFADIAPGECVAFWVRRTAANTAAMTSDGAVLTIVGETL